MRSSRLALTLVALVGCASPPTEGTFACRGNADCPSAVPICRGSDMRCWSTPDPAPVDAGAGDAGPVDSGPSDGSTRDAALIDANALDSSTSDASAPDAGSAEAARCLATGGTVSTSLCCGSSGDFPSSCLTGACGCSPGSSHTVMVCECPSAMCFDPATGCVSG